MAGSYRRERVLPLRLRSEETAAFGFFFFFRFIREHDVVRFSLVPHREVFTRSDTQIDSLGEMPPDVSRSSMSFHLKKKK